MIIDSVVEVSKILSKIDFILANHSYILVREC